MPTADFPQTPAQRRAGEEMARRAEARTRWTCDLYRFWSVCSFKPCTRARACRGDPDACRERWMPYVPDDAKRAAYVMLGELAAGRSLAEAQAAADADADNFHALTARIEQARAGTPARDIAPDTEQTARLRSL